VVHEQLGAKPGHEDFYALAGELVDTLRSLESLAGVLARQVAGYGEGRVLRDDEGRDPAVRLVDAAWQARELLAELIAAEWTANRFWSEIGHVAVEDGAR
jgi:hypothetical protein